MKSTLLFAILLWGLSAPAKDLSECSAEAVSTFDHYQCLELEAKKQSDHLTAVYSDLSQYLKESFGSESEESLRLGKAQNAWTIFTDLNCSFEGAAMLGGTSEEILAHQCRIRESQKRVEELLRQMKQFDDSL
ncbi:lysozyme inhibitor LprI family protein [Bdellovibrio bacteriovorus]|uniref:lysozyme inhibitor LprI family protein n=1 Tax=Bdellovibrio TaxID=958 RepID=UPI0035A94479